ncbi:MAG TPA: DUF433 domain-containing protein [Pseudonocardiaceae bacterium]|nr:DUF433 domain-containing protein [Pseudonocardiaceae bacterium]
MSDGFIVPDKVVGRAADEIITVDPERMGGLPCIRDTRVTVSAILGQLAAGRDVAEVLEDYQYLTGPTSSPLLAFAATVRRTPI